MKSFKILVLAMSMILSFSGVAAQAGHVGGFVGGSLLHSSTVASGNANAFVEGLDLTMSLTPAFEFGGFFQTAPSSAKTIIAAEFNMFPMIMNAVSIGGKIGNAKVPSGNYLCYGPSLGLNHDLIPSFFSIGVEADYFIYSLANSNDLSLLANVKIWF